MMNINYSLIYSEGNWVEINDDSPYVIIGNSGHGKTLLNRVLSSESSMEYALKAGFLSFDSTRLSSNNVGFPIDVVLYEKNSYEMHENRYMQEDMINLSKEWDENLKSVLDQLPEHWIKKPFYNVVSKNNKNEI